VCDAKQFFVCCRWLATLIEELHEDDQGGGRVSKYATGACPGTDAGDKLTELGKSMRGTQLPGARSYREATRSY
jgi:hypothetical protein